MNVLIVLTFISRKRVEEVPTFLKKTFEKNERVAFLLIF